MRRTLAAALVLLGAAALLVALVVVLERSIAPRPIDPTAAPGAIVVRAWQPVEVEQDDGTRVWIVSDRGGSLMPPFILVPPTPAPGPPLLPAYRP